MCTGVHLFTCLIRGYHFFDKKKSHRFDFLLYVKPWPVVLFIRVQLYAVKMNYNEDSISCILYLLNNEINENVYSIKKLMKLYNYIYIMYMSWQLWNQWVTVPSCDVSSCMSRPVSSSSSTPASYGRIRPSDSERWSFWRGFTLLCVDKRLAEFDRWMSSDDSFPELSSDTGCKYDILRPDGIEKREFRRVDSFL